MDAPVETIPFPNGLGILRVETMGQVVHLQWTIFAGADDEVELR